MQQATIWKRKGRLAARQHSCLNGNGSHVVSQKYESAPNYSGALCDQFVSECIPFVGISSGSPDCCNPEIIEFQINESLPSGPADQRQP